MGPRAIMGLDGVRFFIDRESFAFFADSEHGDIRGY